MANEKSNLNESPRQGGFYRLPALSGKPEDDRYVDSEGHDIPKEEVDKFKGEMEKKSSLAEDESNKMADGSALSPAAALRTPTNQRGVVDTRSDDVAAGEARAAARAEADAQRADTAGGTRGSL